MNHLKPVSLNEINTFPFQNSQELFSYVNQQKKILIAVNAEKILNSTPQTKEIINRNIGYADGIGAVWALKRKGIKNVVKIPGCELWLELIKAFYKEKSFYLVGGKPEVIKATVAKLKLNFPEINILNYRDGYLKTKQENNTLIKDIALHKPDVVFVAMGSPKQELLMEEMMKVHPAIYQGLGGSFDVFTGTVKRAPQWWVNNNLEWAYRLVKQPTRIKRQIHLINFLWLLVFNKI
jgi:UDP-N-acetyl-D-mannosaminouronate:lipid I N-acetyl-D-mannosaminouronosyltransferase